VVLLLQVTKVQVVELLAEKMVLMMEFVVVV